MGYTTLGVADWNGDGLLDLVLNSIWGKVVWFPNLGTPTKPSLGAMLPIKVQWEGPARAWLGMAQTGKRGIAHPVANHPFCHRFQS